MGLVLLCAIPGIAQVAAAEAPQAPTITDTDPDSPANENNPQVKGTVGPDATQVRLYKNPSCAGAPDATGAVVEFTGAGIAVAVAEGTTTALSAEASDAAGNVSACSDAFTYTADSTATCDKIASPTGNGLISSLFQTPQELVNSLAPGETGCLRGGTYEFSETAVTEANITLAPYGSEAVTLRGSIKVRPSGHDSTIRGMALDGRGGASPIGPRIYADGTVLRDNEITNGHTSICVQVSSYYSDPAPRGVVIEHNRIHDCGELPSTNKDHGIYLAAARDTVIRDNWIYDNADRGVQLYPDSQRTTVTGNVIEANGDGLVINGSDTAVPNDNVVEGNIIADSKLGWNTYSGQTGPVAVGNHVRNNCVWASNTNAAYNSNGGVQAPSRNYAAYDNLISRPGFVDPPTGDFHLQWGDSCLAKYTGTMSLPVGPPPPPPPQRTLTVQTQGSGTGTVTGPGIGCPGDCTETYTDGQQVTLTASSSGGSSFAGWGGACSGTGGCQLTMDADKQATASFNPPLPPPPPATGSYTLRPNVDLASAWRVIGASSAWAALDDNLLQPTTPGATDYIQPSVKGQVTTVGFETQALNGAVAQGATVWYYGTTKTNTKLQLDVRWGDVTRATYTLPTGKAYAWRSLSVVPPNQDAADDLNLRLTALGGTNVIVRAAYVTLSII